MVLLPRTSSDQAKDRDRPRRLRSEPRRWLANHRECHSCVQLVNLQSPALRSAAQTCLHLLPGGSHPPAISEAQRRQTVAMARCMRTHGVPSFPDPTFPKGGGMRLPFPPGVTPTSPAFQAAAKACGLGVSTGVAQSAGGG
jgi:hypothetical protein